jgi:hypothetical protein
VAVGKLYFEGGVGECFKHSALKFNYVILWHKNSSLSIVCDTD